MWIDSICKGDDGGKSYVLLPGKRGVADDDLQFQEFAMYTHRALQSQGLVQAQSFSNAEVAIFLNYDISDPQEYQYSYAIPIFGQTGVSSAHTYGNLFSFGNSAIYCGSTTYTPTYGIVGSVQGSGTYVLFTRYISLTAYDLRAVCEANRQVQLWKTEIFSTGVSGDLRMVFPVMMAGAATYIGRNTGHEVQVRLFPSDPRIQGIRGARVGNEK